MLKTFQVALEIILNESTKNDLVSTKFKIPVGNKIHIIIIITLKVTLSQLFL